VFSSQRKDVKYREDIKHAKEQTKTLQKTVAKEQAKAVKADSDGAEYKALLEKSEVEAATLSEVADVEQAKMDEIYEGLKGETEALRGALEAKKEELAP
jgi:structural maintenance of chromosome 4